MRDELADAWTSYEALLARFTALEEIAERMVATCADPIAVTDYFDWKARG